MNAENMSMGWVRISSCGQAQAKSAGDHHQGLSNHSCPSNLGRSPCQYADLRVEGVEGGMHVAVRLSLQLALPSCPDGSRSVGLISSPDQEEWDKVHHLQQCFGEKKTS